MALQHISLWGFGAGLNDLVIDLESVVKPAENLGAIGIMESIRVIIGIQSIGFLQVEMGLPKIAVFFY